MDDESNGVVAAEIAVLVPSLRASLRVMCPLIVLPDSQDYIPVKPLSTQFKSVQIRFENTSHQKPLPFPCHQLTCLRQVKRGMPRGDIGSPSTHECPLPWQQPSPFQPPSPICHSERSEESAVRPSGAPHLPFYNHSPLVIPPAPACRMKRSACGSADLF
jgi:hypothetical protein